MRRGIVEITNQQSKYLRGLELDLSSDLAHKIAVTLPNQMDLIRVELSEDEINTLLDLLPVPGQHPLADSIRSTLNEDYAMIAELEVPED